jgi:hypothetical protein
MNIMRINKYDITLKNIWAYIQGNSRMIGESLGMDVFKSPKHIQEQIIWREVIHNKDCYKAGECIYPLDNPCHCKVPDKLYSDKECEGGCYPQIMDETTWDKFKNICGRRKINIFVDKFDWDVILSDINILDESYFSSVIDTGRMSVNLGNVKEDGVLTHSFEFFNPDDTPLVINSVNPSCGCCSVNIPEPIEKDHYGKMKCIIKPEGLEKGDHEVWITVRYNDIKRINLKLNYTIK